VYVQVFCVVYLLCVVVGVNSSCCLLQWCGCCVWWGVGLE